MKHRLLLVAQDLNQIQLLSVPDAHLASERHRYYLELLVIETDIDNLIRVSRDEPNLHLTCPIQQPELAQPSSVSNPIK